MYKKYKDLQNKAVRRKRKRQTQPLRHITLEEQDARVSVNFTQKRQEKKCNTFVGKKKK